MQPIKRQATVFWRWINAGGRAEDALYVLSLVLMAGSIIWQFGLPGIVFVIGAALYIGLK